MLTADKEEDKFRDRQAVMMAEKHVCEPQIEAAGRQIQIYIQAEIQIHAGILYIQKYTDEQTDYMATTDIL
jgi:hypothetical protein